MEFIHFEPQSDFPRSDISVSNAAMLEALLRDPGVQETAHDNIERSSIMMRMAHRVFSTMLATTPEFNSKSAYWFSAGVTQYEAASSLLRLSDTHHPEYYDSITPAHHMAHLLHHNNQNEYFTRSYLDFLEEQPLFSDVISSVTEETIDKQRSAVEHALYGAAVQRQIELDAMGVSESVILGKLEFDIPDDLIL